MSKGFLLAQTQGHNRNRGTCSSNWVRSAKSYRLRRNDWTRRPGPAHHSFRSLAYLFPFLFGGLRRRTPRPPPFSSMNSTPADLSALRTTKLLAVVIAISPSATSARLIVFTPSADALARSSAPSQKDALIRLWQEKRGEAKPADLSGERIVQSGARHRGAQFAGSSAIGPPGGASEAWPA